jgi:ribonuclease-3
VPGDQEVRSLKDILDEALSGLPEELRDEALTHVSYSNERGPGVRCNERLEFLGDAVLYLAAAHLLYQRYPDMPEGDLTRMRASVVSGQNLAEVALQAGLGDCLRLGRGEEASGGRLRPRLLAGALEAVIGALFVYGGWSEAKETVKEMLLRDLSPGVSGRPAAVPVDPKTIVQERVQRVPGRTLDYRVLRVDGPDHSPWYTVSCVVAGVEVSTGQGPSKKDAEEDAAANLMKSNAALPEMKG